MSKPTEFFVLMFMKRGGGKHNLVPFKIHNSILSMGFE